MIQSINDKFIRDKEFISCTITSVTDDGLAKIDYAPFKKALFPISTIVIYEYQNNYYYPLAMEFRLIDNNILYLIEELGINKISKIFQVLTSSMDKEEKWSNEFELSVIHLIKEPKYCLKLKDLDISNVKVQHIYE
jgi:hypothetical protein